MNREELFQKVFNSDRAVRNSINVNELVEAMSLEGEGAWCKTCKVYIPMMQLPIHMLTTLKKVPGISSTGKVQPVCPKCFRKPSAEENEIRYQDVVAAAQKRLQDGEKNRYLMPTPERYIDAALENFEMRQGTEKAIKGAIYFIEKIPTKKEKGLFLQGGFGSGKTRLCYSLKHTLESMGIKVIVYNVTQLLDRIRSTFNNDKESKQEIMAMLMKCDVLILDDLGAEKPSEFAAEFLYTIIDYRYSTWRRMVITSNCSNEELQERLGHLQGGRILDRLKEACYKIPITAGSARQ
ncbi:ATP-binding protein [Bacillus sp. NPDC077411]|uniref:ATP-binding protein n=1 Tax=Bacillus sp. NPDC077411 TaxID=3363947 RepID=UPI0037C61497